MINVFISAFLLLLFGIVFIVMIKYESYKYMSAPSSCLITDLEDTVPLSMYEIAKLDDIGKKIVKTYLEEHNEPITRGLYRIFRGNADYNLKEMEARKTNAQTLKDQSEGLNVRI